MATYPQPSGTTAIFDPADFLTNEEPLTITDGDNRYLRYPIAQGAETIANLTTTNLTSTNINTTNFTTTTFSATNLTATGTLSVKNGAGVQTSTLTQNTTTLNINGYGDVSIKPANDFNVLTGTGKLVNISCPDSAGASTNMTLNTGVANAGSYVAISSPTTYLIGLSTQPSLVLSGGFGTIYGMTFTRGGTALNAVNRIQSPNAGDTFYLGAGSSGANNITLTNGQTLIASGLVQPKLSYGYQSQTAITPYIGGTYFSDYAATAQAPGTVYYPFSTTSGWNTNTGTAYDANGGILLPAGIYNGYFAMNGNGSTQNYTDMRLAFITISNLTSSVEADWIAVLPTVPSGTAGTKNYTCFFHKTDNTGTSANDTEQFVLTSVFYVDGSTTIYPCTRWNRGTTNTTLRGNVIFTRIG